MTKKTRCGWITKDNMRKYHDEEWGVPVHDDNKHFEFLILEGAQAGLSWQTILDRREGYHRTFAGFDPKKVAKFTSKDVKRLLKDKGIIRNKLKVNSAINNAKRFLEVQEEFGSFDDYIWGFVDGKTIKNKWTKLRQLPVQTKESRALSKDLRSRGFIFVGPTIIYAHMQATGLVNDHLVDCFRYGEV